MEQLPVREVPEEQKLYTRQQISDLIGLDHSTISRWEKKGKITPSQKINGISFYTHQQYLDIKTQWEQKPSAGTGVLCKSCNRRQARFGSTLCSRCSFHELENKLRDTLPGMETDDASGGTAAVVDTTDSLIAEVDEEQFCPTCGSDDPDEKKMIKTGDPDFPMTVECSNHWHDEEHRPKTDFVKIPEGVNTYTRRQLSDMLDVSPSTISRWERKGKIPPPIRIVHSNQYIYTDKHVEEAKKYQALVEEFRSTPASPLSQAGRTMNSSKFSRRVEKVVASRIGFRRGSLI